jgi:hypothetical protein
MKSPDNVGRYARTVAQTISAAGTTVLKRIAWGLAAPEWDPLATRKHDQIFLLAATA